MKLYGEDSYNLLSKEEQLVGFDGENIGFSFYLWQKIDNKFLKKLKEKMIADLKEYYKDLGVIGNIEIFE